MAPVVTDASELSGPLETPGSVVLCHKRITGADADRLTIGRQCKHSLSRQQRRRVQSGAGSELLDPLERDGMGWPDERENENTGN